MARVKAEATVAEDCGSLQVPKAPASLGSAEQRFTVDGVVLLRVLATAESAREVSHLEKDCCTIGEQDGCEAVI